MPAASCFRLLGAVACELGLDLCYFDAEQAFVQSNLEEDIVMRIPQGCVEMSDKVVPNQMYIRDYWMMLYKQHLQ